MKNLNEISLKSKVANHIGKNTVKSRFGKIYTIQNVIGRGGGSVVYECSEIVNDVEVKHAMKISTESKDNVHELSIGEYIKSSARIMAKTNSKFVYSAIKSYVLPTDVVFFSDTNNIKGISNNILKANNGPPVGTYNIGYVMPLCKPISSNNFLRMPLATFINEVAAIFFDIGSALTILQNGIEKNGIGKVHNDLKIPNITVTNEGRYALIDFGLTDTHGVDNPGSFIGTVGSLSEDQLMGRTRYRTDLYALLLVLIECYSYWQSNISLKLRSNTYLWDTANEFRNLSITHTLSSGENNAYHLISNWFPFERGDMLVKAISKGFGQYAALSQDTKVNYMDIFKIMFNGLINDKSIGDIISGMYKSKK